MADKRALALVSRPPAGKLTLPNRFSHIRPVGLATNLPNQFLLNAVSWKQNIGDDWGDLGFQIVCIDLEICSFNCTRIHLAHDNCSRFDNVHDLIMFTIWCTAVWAVQIAEVPIRAHHICSHADLTTSAYIWSGRGYGFAESLCYVVDLTHRLDCVRLIDQVWFMFD